MKNTVQPLELTKGISIAQHQLEQLLSARQSLVLATHAEYGECELGTAPFVWDEGAFALLLSRLAPHTRHLEAGSRPKIMLLEDEVDVRQPFARQRLTLTCDVQRLERDDARSEALFVRMEQCLGSIVPVLRGLADFHIYVLRPAGGRFVAGFGKAYRLEGLQVIEHLRG